MRKLIITSVALFAFCTAFSQNVGIGTSTPAAKLHIVNNGSVITELGNSASLNTNINTELFLKTGSYYTGIIGTYGTGINTSRLGFSTYASSNPDNLSERLSILDNGNVGINTTSPAYRLDINGAIHGSSSLLIDGNLGIGTLAPTAKLEVIGNLKVDGKITRPGTGLSNLVPSAMGSIYYNGSIRSTTGNFTVTKSNTEPGLYFISLADDSFVWSNRSQYTILVSLEGAAGSAVSFIVPETIFVRTFSVTQSGTLVQDDQDFNIVIFRR